ncbi:MAG: ATP-binding cassette domain-containing protein, partial [Desulfovibrio sp.]|nr:ATP-binding cassette domain-containing protein [Desulfovibrio sp.]
MTAPLIRIKHLSKRFERRRGLMAGTPGVCAVRDVSLCVDRGKTLGIVGESGCGKSTLGRMAVGLLAPSGGEVYVNGRALWNKAEHTSYAAFRRSLAGVLQMVFQDPYSSLNPRMRIGNSVAEPLLCSDSWR